MTHNKVDRTRKSGRVDGFHQEGYIIALMASTLRIPVRSDVFSIVGSIREVVYSLVMFHSYRRNATVSGLLILKVLKLIATNQVNIVRFSKQRRGTNRE